VNINHLTDHAGNFIPIDLARLSVVCTGADGNSPTFAVRKNLICSLNR
jgi:hypothetical protein